MKDRSEHAYDVKKGIYLSASYSFCSYKKFNCMTEASFFNLKK